MSKPMDLVGQVFGRLTVLERAANNKWHSTMWLCACTCGITRVIHGRSLKKGLAFSCGCWNREVLKKRNTKHGQSGTLAYRLWEGAKYRAKKLGLMCDLHFTDINIPDVCPILGLPLYKGTDCLSDNSPTLDRIDSAGGYTKDNVWVISHRANRLKNDAATPEELELIARKWRERLQ